MGSEERKIFIAFGVAAFFIGALVFYFIFNILRQQRKYRILQKEKLDAEINTSELERGNIATELHNDIGPYLSSIKLRLEIIQTEHTDDIEACKRALDKCISQIRDISKSLAPFSKYQHSFLDALHSYVFQVNISGNLKVEIIELNEIQLSVEQSNQVYRILQEVIQNTIKHAKASLLKIEISTSDGMMLVRTSDNGIGYKMDAVRSKNKLGLGLLGIYSKVDYLNGTISKDETTKTGTKYNIRIPIQDKK